MTPTTWTEAMATIFFFLYFFMKLYFLFMFESQEAFR